jgi:hypothetical protein
MKTNRFEPGARVILMYRIGDRDPGVVPCIEWAKVAEEINQRSTHPDYMEVTYKQYGETRTETWLTSNLRMDRR